MVLVVPASLAVDRTRIETGLFKNHGDLTQHLLNGLNVCHLVPGSLVLSADRCTDLPLPTTICSCYSLRGEGIGMGANRTLPS